MRRIYAVVGWEVVRKNALLAWKVRIFAFWTDFLWNLLRFCVPFYADFRKIRFFVQKGANFWHWFFNVLRKICKNSENFFKNELDVSSRFMYKSRHTDTVKLERPSGSKESARQSRARQFSISRTFRGTKAELRSSPPDTTFRVGCRRG